MIFPNFSFKSFKSFDRHKIAITSEATTISKPSSLGTPLAFPFNPSTMKRSCLSFISTTLFKVIVLASISNSFPWLIWLSNIAASKLFAAPIALKSPVKCKFISSIGTTWAYPPPAAPPLTPKTGPKEGSLSARDVLFPILFNPSPSPTTVVVFPSPAGVGVIAVTKINFPFGLSL